MPRLRAKSLLLTGYLEELLRREVPEEVQVFTPTDTAQRGCQLSLCFTACTATTAAAEKARVDLDTILQLLKAEGVICDARKPNVIRIAPAPLYNSFSDVFNFVRVLKGILASLH